MENERPQFAVRLEAKRRARGMTQQDLAGILGVSHITIFRWEDGVSLPEGKNHIDNLIAKLGFTVSELEALYEQFILNKDSMKRKYQIGGYEFAYQNFPSWEVFLNELIVLDEQEMNVTPEQEGTPEHWAPIFEKNPSTWKVVTHQGSVVGYWHYLALTSQAFDQAIAGNFDEAKVSPFEMEMLVDEGNYRMFISQIVLDTAHREEQANVALRKSFLKQIRDLAIGGFFFEKICAYAFTDDGVRVCTILGMEPLGSPSADGDPIYYIDGSQIWKRGTLSRDKTIARLYRQKFSGG